MRHDEFARHEADAHDLIEALGQLAGSRDRQTAADFEAQVMARAAREPVPRRGLWSWLFDRLWIPESPPLQIALAALSVLILVGSVSQYVTWVNAYWMGIPPDELREARIQEHMWQKNFDCAAQLNHTSANYAAIAGDQVSVVTWACPSGDVLVTLASVSDEVSQRSIWVALDAPDIDVHLLDWLTPSAFAASPDRMAQRQRPRLSVLCQKRLPKKRLLRRIQQQPGQCVDEVIDTRNGKVVERRKAPCQPC
ncbi:hypothetical protein C2W62_24675 [Candidatus Entotheonella serta]|nr:hypothetical protein C2W62_24675 [Candidatus Entotheonella serta]